LLALTLKYELLVSLVASSLPDLRTRHWFALTSKSKLMVRLALLPARRGTVDAAWWA